MHDDERVEIVRRVLDELGESFGNCRTVFEAYLAPDVLWENSGRPAVHGIDAAVALVEEVMTTLDMQSSRTDFRHVAATDGAVLVERVDHFFRSDGSLIASLPLMGAFEFEGSRIRRWSDYYDSGYARREAT